MVTIMAKRVPGLVQKNNSYYFRLRVPVNLIAAIGKKEVTEPLGRLSQPQASIKAREWSAHYSALFLTLLNELGIEPTAPAAPALPRRSPTMAEAEHIASAGARKLLLKDELIRSSGNNDADDLWSGVLRDIDDDVAAALAGGSQGSLYPRFKADLAAHGLVAPTDRDELRLMVYRWAAVYGKTVQQVKQRVKGEPVDTPEKKELLPSLKDNTASRVTDPTKMTVEQLKMGDIFKLWKDHDPNRNNKTVATAALAVQRFESMMDNPSISELTRARGADFRKVLLASELSAGTASSTLVWINILLNFEVDNYQRIIVNPWKKLGITANAPTIRDEWTDSQAVKLFSDPIFQNYQLPKSKNAGVDAGYWIPVIAAYTGARASEIAQLLVDDLIVIDGIQCFRIAVTNSATQSLKNEPSKRNIPIHPELVRLGLLDYRAAIGGLGAVRLFPALGVSQVNGAGGGLSTWFSKFKSAHGFGPENTFHGWRNTVESKLQRVREGQLYIDRYLGHKPEGMGAGTYARVKPADLVGTAASIAYDGLSLPRVYTVPEWKP
jgi:integrase